MLVGKGQLLDLQIVRYAQEAVDMNAEGMSSQFRVSAYTKASESVCMVGFYGELCAQLTGDCFDDLADPIVKAMERCWDLFLLVAARLGQQADAIVLPEFLSDRSADVGLVADDDAIAVFYEAFVTDSQVAVASRS